MRKQAQGRGITMSCVISKEQETSLRQELKQWEKSFAASHEGRHASREDIKKDPAIAARYKEYNRLRDVAAGQVTTSAQLSRKRKLVEVTNQPQPAAKLSSTPQKSRRLQVENDHHEDDDKETASPQEGPPFIGPTPQKDGRVLGLFDLLSENQGTPSKSKSHAKVPDVDMPQPNSFTLLQQTPRKGKGGEDLLHPLQAARIEATPTTANKHSRTPQSLGKRFLLDSFLTPSKRRRLNDQETPTSTSRHPHSNTPAFLSRYRGLEPIAEDQDADIPPADRPLSRSGTGRPQSRRRTFTRSLSTMIAELRQVEEDRLDEEMDLMREMEGVGPSKPSTSATATATTSNKRSITTSTRTSTQGQPKQPTLQVQDSQPLGPDGTTNLSGSSDDENGTAGRGRDGQPLRVWKKRGQKRTTKKSNMKPQPRRRSPGPVKAVEELEDTEEGEAPEDKMEEEPTKQRQKRARRKIIVRETQRDADADASTSEHSNSSANSDNDENYEGEDASIDDEAANGSDSLTKTKTSSKAAPAPSKPAKTATTPAQESAIAKVAKKISSTAHANFRRLKIKSSKGAKAATAGGGGRFGGKKFGRGRR